MRLIYVSNVMQNLYFSFYEFLTCFLIYKLDKYETATARQFRMQFQFVIGDAEFL